LRRSPISIAPSRALVGLSKSGGDALDWQARLPDPSVVGLALAKSIYAVPTSTGLAALVSERGGLRAALSLLPGS
jgi:hypothetical protein